MIKQNGLAGGLNTIGIIGTIISAQIVDRIGRRKCLMYGAAGLFAVNLIVSLPSLPKLSFERY
jgi:MFS family permease